MDSDCGPCPVVAVVKWLVAPLVGSLNGELVSGATGGIQVVT